MLSCAEVVLIITAGCFMMAGTDSGSASDSTSASVSNSISRSSSSSEVA